MTSSDLSAFEAEVHNFIGEHLTPDLNKAASLGFGISRADGERWHKAVYNQGWIAPDWPVEHGGTGWSLRQKQIFSNATALAGAPMIMPFGLDMVGPV
ncbi:MAG: acyl-CoA dehydrogenase family protein, partial [Pseudomonadota bacterium]|nr:acyl-CoA dehydrogenase family protein [Pseudomonadota bacterium]